MFTRPAPDTEILVHLRQKQSFAFDHVHGLGRTVLRTRPHSVFFVMTMQSSFTNLAFPICTSFFASASSGSMAPEGQTWPQTTQS
jgi:hypothetical protein